MSMLSQSLMTFGSLWDYLLSKRQAFHACSPMGQTSASSSRAFSFAPLYMVPKLPKYCFHTPDLFTIKKNFVYMQNLILKVVDSFLSRGLAKSMSCAVMHFVSLFLLRLHLCLFVSLFSPSFFIHSHVMKN